MKIVEASILPSMLAKQDPEWRFALASHSHSQGWVVSLVDEDGFVGYGFSSTTAHFGVTVESVKAILDRFASLLLGKDPRRITEILLELDKTVAANHQPKSAVDCALHDLTARRLGVPIYSMFGGPAVCEFPALRILPIKTPEKMASNARRLVEQGVRYFKIKVGGNVEEDAACVAAVREEVGKDIHLTIDANQSYSPKDAIVALNKMAPFKIDLAEQPVPAHDLRGLKLVTDSVPIPIEADESAYSLEQVFMICRERAADAVSLKLSKLGGLRKTHAAAMICEAAGLKYRMGAHSGPRLLAAHGIQLAAALPGIWYASELSEFDGLAEDPWEGLSLSGGTLHLTDAPGCGVTPNLGSPYPRKKA